MSHQNVNLTDRDEQIKSIALSVGSSGVICDIADFYSFGLVNCNGLGVKYEANYDHDLVKQIIDNYTTQANSAYRNLKPIIEDLRNVRRLD